MSWCVWNPSYCVLCWIIVETLRSECPGILVALPSYSVLVIWSPFVLWIFCLPALFTVAFGVTKTDPCRKSQNSKKRADTSWRLPSMTVQPQYVIFVLLLLYIDKCSYWISCCDIKQRNIPDFLFPSKPSSNSLGIPCSKAIWHVIPPAGVGFNSGSAT